MCKENKAPVLSGTKHEGTGWVGVGEVRMGSRVLGSRGGVLWVEVMWFLFLIHSELVRVGVSGAHGTGSVLVSFHKHFSRANISGRQNCSGGQEQT